MIKRKINHNNIFFMGDVHIDHKNVLKFDNRPFKDLEEMERVILENIHKYVPKDGILVLDGDVGMNKERSANFIKKIKRKVWHVKGNHDDFNLDHLDNVEFSCDRLEVNVKDDSVKGGYRCIIVCHYPMLSWNKSFHGSWHFHAHTHGSIIHSKNDAMSKFASHYYNIMNVIEISLNMLNYIPLSYEGAKNIMDKKKRKTFV